MYKIKFAYNVQIFLHYSRVFHKILDFSEQLLQPKTIPIVFEHVLHIYLPLFEFKYYKHIYMENILNANKILPISRIDPSGSPPPKI